MPLHEMQQHWIASLYAPSAEGEPLPDGFWVYRNNLRGNLCDALADCYPTVLKLVGERYFSQCARQYLRSQPSRSGDLHHFGEHFADTAEQVPGAKALPYLGDMARLEWLMHESFHAADVTALKADQLDPRILAAPERWLIDFHPSVRICISNHPVMRIWTFNQDDSGDTLALGSTGQSVLLFRSGLEVSLASISRPTAVWIQQLMDGAPLGNATENALITDPDFDVQTSLTQLFAEALIVGVELTEK